MAANEPTHNPPPPDPSASSSRPVKGILKTGKSRDKAPKIVVQSQSDDHVSGIQWDEMNILMTEHPPGKDYGHMKIEEPKTPYHEMLADEEIASGEAGLSADALAERVLEVAETGGSSRWEQESSGSEMDPEEGLSEEAKEHKRQFREWRKKHYNEFYAVQRARELLKRDEEELAQEEAVELQGEPMQQDTST